MLIIRKVFCILDTLYSVSDSIPIYMYKLRNNEEFIFSHSILESQLVYMYNLDIVFHIIQRKIMNDNNF